MYMDHINYIDMVSYVFMIIHNKSTTMDHCLVKIRSLPTPTKTKAGITGPPGPRIKNEPLGPRPTGFGPLIPELTKDELI